MIKTILIQDETILNTNFHDWLVDSPEISVVGAASSGTAGIKLATESLADVIIINFKLADMSGLKVASELLNKQPRLHVLFVMPEFNETASSGIKAYVPHNIDKHSLVNVIKNLKNEQSITSPLTLPSNFSPECLINGFVQTVLSKREIDVLRFMLNGLSITAIANVLSLSAKTVGSYRARIFSKLKVRSDIELVFFVLKEDRALSEV